MTKCFQVHALDDIMVNSAHNVVLALEITLVPSLTHVHLGRLNISVKDNDGKCFSFVGTLIVGKVKMNCENYLVSH